MGCGVRKYFAVTDLTEEQKQSTVILRDDTPRA